MHQYHNDILSCTILQSFTESLVYTLLIVSYMLVERTMHRISNCTFYGVIICKIAIYDVEPNFVEPVVDRKLIEVFGN